MELSTLRDRVAEIAENAAIGDGVADIVLEADKDADGDDFLRVILKIRGLDRASYEDLASLVTSIETVVGDLDERFPSVRFAEAA
jgi:hypothetical protein